jgi:site-specific recombinase XerD
MDELTNNDDNTANVVKTMNALAGLNFKTMFENASPEQLEAMTRAYLAQRIQENFSSGVKLAAIDYCKEKETFIDNAGRSKSRFTALTYRNALEGQTGLEAFCSEHNISLLELSPAQADDFIYWKSRINKSATVRTTAAVAASFFSFLERRYRGVVSNPFRGTRALPPKQNAIPHVPTEAEVSTIIASVPPVTAAAIGIMAYRGLRVGALPALAIKGRRFRSTTKGREISGDLPDKAVELVKDAGLDPCAPFRGMSREVIQHAVSYQLDKLYKDGIVRFRFSPHKFRHFFAVSHYSKEHDIKSLQQLLGHSSIAVTDAYLRSLDVADYQD